MGEVSIRGRFAGATQPPVPRGCCCGRIGCERDRATSAARGGRGWSHGRRHTTHVQRSHPPRAPAPARDRARRRARRRQRHAARRPSCSRSPPRTRHSDIAFWIHSPGGSVPSMLAIRDVMRLIPNDVATLALGLACSAGQFLLSAGTKGKRCGAAARAHPHAPGLVRHRRLDGRGRGAGRRPAPHARHRLGLVAEDTGQSVERIFEDSLHDRWYTAARGARVRLHRPRRGAVRPGHARAGAARSGSGCGMSTLHDPERHRPAPARRTDHGCLQPPARRADRLPRHRASTPASRTRSSRSCCTSSRQDPEQEISSTSTARAATCRRCSRSTTRCSSSARRSRRRASGEAVGAGAALLAAGAAGRRAALPHARIVLHQPAAQGRGTDPRPDPAGGRAGAHAPGPRGRARRCTPARPSRRCGTTPTATGCSPRRRRATTG